MAKKKKDEEAKVDDFAEELIKEINRAHNDKIAFNFGTDDAPSNVKRWISTGSRQLDFIIANSLNGGCPEGRIVEIQGPTGSGKSHIAFEVAKATQKMGGIVIYIDTENATSLNLLMQLGIDVKRNFAFVQTGCTEEIFAVAERTILRARAMTKDVPVTIVWDSVAASSPKAELEGDYDQNTIGLQARILGRGFRKIVNIIGNQNVLFLLINQQRVNIGVMFGDPLTTPGGNAIPYASSVRIRITSTGQNRIMDKEKNVIGIKVKAHTIKNKVARPFRTCEFEIHFGIGVVEHEQVFDLFRSHCSNLEGCGVPCKDKFVSVEGTGAWKYFKVFDKHGSVLLERKFYKTDFGKILYDPENKDYIDALYVDALTMGNDTKNHPTFVGVNMNSVEEVKALKKK